MKLLITMFVLLLSTIAMGDEAVRVDRDLLPPDWMLDVVIYLNSLPGIGPALKTIFEWIAALSVITTRLCATAILTLRTLAPLLRSTGLINAAVLVETHGPKVVYWLKYVSLFNAKKSKTAGEIVAEKK
jgi:hypothetical protein